MRWVIMQDHCNQSSPPRKPPRKANKKKYFFQSIKIMNKINPNKYLIGKKKMGKGKVGTKGGQATKTGAFGGTSKFNKKRLDNKL